MFQIFPFFKISHKNYTKMEAGEIGREGNYIVIGSSYFCLFLLYKFSKLMHYWQTGNLIYKKLLDHCLNGQDLFNFVHLCL